MFGVKDHFVYPIRAPDKFFVSNFDKAFFVLSYKEECIFGYVFYCLFSWTHFMAFKLIFGTPPYPSQFGSKRDKSSVSIILFAEKL